MEENTPLQPEMNEELPRTTEEVVPNTENENKPTEPSELSEHPETPEHPEHPENPETPETPEAQEPQPDYSNLDREGLLEALKELLKEDIQSVKGRASALRTRFNDLTREIEKETKQEEKEASEDTQEEEKEEKAKDELAAAFYHLYDEYRERRKKYLADLEVQKQKNYEAKQALIEELKGLIDSENEQVRSALDKFNAIQDKWKAIGDVPRERMNDLWQSYHFQIEQFFSKLKINRELRELDQKHNLEQKITLCEKAEELIVEPSITKAFKELQDLRAQWREIGPVPAEQNEEIWQRFQNAANQIDERRREFYEQRKEEFENNLLAKRALIEKAEQLTAEQPQSVRQWNDLTTALDELLKVWKTIGPVPREVNEEIWTQFKGMIDRHYAEKKEYFATVRDEQDSNYQKKIELCLKAEAIAQREDWKKATEELLALQEEWKSIGATSRKVSEKVWQRFRGACDTFFAKKGEFFKERRTAENDNLAKKESILAELKAHPWGESREENLEAIKDFQRRWAEVGFVPMADKERLQKEFRGEINRVFEQLKISAREAEETAYRERLRNVAGDAKRFVADEKQQLREQIEKLRADLNLWENNLGFLSSSKQADLLKEEFEKRMQGARQQIALLQAKLRILNETEKAGKEEDKKDAE